MRTTVVAAKTRRRRRRNQKRRRHELYTETKVCKHMVCRVTCKIHGTCTSGPSRDICPMTVPRKAPWDRHGRTSRRRRLRQGTPGLHASASECPFGQRWRKVGGRKGGASRSTQVTRDGNSNRRGPCLTNWCSIALFKPTARLSTARKDAVG